VCRIKRSVENLCKFLHAFWRREQSNVLTWFSGLACTYEWSKKMMWWQWHKLNRMQIICTSLKTDDHASTSSLNFYRPDAFSDAQPTVSKHWRQNVTNTSLNKMYSIFSETWKFKNLNLKSSVSNMWTPIGYRTSCQWRELCSLEVNLLPNEWKSENLVIIKCINSHFIVDFVLQ